MTLPTSRAAAPRADDWPTVAALALAAYAVASVVHEALGHGAACLLAGGRVAAWSSVHLGCDFRAFPAAAQWPRIRLLAAAGTLASIGAGAAVLAWFQRAVRRGRVWDAGLAFRWLAAAALLLQGTGYPFFSGASGLGDWAAVFAGVAPAVGWRVPLTVGGFALYAATAIALFRALARALGGHGPALAARAVRLAVAGYVGGAAVSLAAGLLARDPSAAPAALFGAAPSLGGTSGLLWGGLPLRGIGAAGRAPRAGGIRRDMRALLLAVAAALAFVAALGPGLRFG